MTAEEAEKFEKLQHFDALLKMRTLPSVDCGSKISLTSIEYSWV